MASEDKAGTFDNQKDIAPGPVHNYRSPLQGPSKVASMAMLEELKHFSTCNLDKDYAQRRPGSTPRTVPAVPTVWLKHARYEWFETRCDVSFTFCRASGFCSYETIVRLPVG